MPQLRAAVQRKLHCGPRRRRGCKRLNLAQGGATTPSLIESQLPAAIALLAKRNGDHKRRNGVKLVTYDSMLVPPCPVSPPPGNPIGRFFNR